MRITLDENQLKNLLTFLDRVQIKGFVEIQAMNELIQIMRELEDEEE